jgi:hypothetical protein
MNAGFFRATSRWLTGLVAGMLFVSQVAAAAQPCMLGMSGGLPASGAQATQDEGCHSMPMDDSACRLQCLAQDEAAASPDQQHNPFAAPAPFAHALVALPAASSPFPAHSIARLPSGPPLRILHCSYQI